MTDILDMNLDELEDFIIERINFVVFFKYRQWGFDTSQEAILEFWNQNVITDICERYFSLVPYKSKRVDSILYGLLYDFALALSAIGLSDEEYTCKDNIISLLEDNFIFNGIKESNSEWNQILHVDYIREALSRFNGQKIEFTATFKKFTTKPNYRSNSADDYVVLKNLKFGRFLIDEWEFKLTKKFDKLNLHPESNLKFLGTVKESDDVYGYKLAFPSKIKLLSGEELEEVKETKYDYPLYAYGSVC
jgi:hypothetical protein